MKRLVPIIKVYFKSWKIYILLWLFIAVVISVPIMLKTFSQGLLEAYNNYVYDTLFVDEIIIESKNNSNWYHAYELGTPIVKYIETTIDQLALSDKVGLTEFFLIDKDDEDIFISTALEEPSFLYNIITSDSIPEGHFSYYPYKENVPPEIVVISKKLGLNKTLKKLEEPTHYPSSLMYEYAINRTDAQKVFAKQTRCFISIDCNGISEEQKVQLIEELSKNEDITCSYDTLSTTHINNFSTDLANDKIKLTKKINLYDDFINSLFIISIISIILFSISINRQTKRRNTLYKHLGCSKIAIYLISAFEVLLSITIGTIIASIIILISKLIIDSRSVPTYFIYSQGYYAPARYSDVFSLNGRYIYNLSLKDILIYFFLYLGMFLFIDFLIKKRDER